MNRGSAQERDSAPWEPSLRIAGAALLLFTVACGGGEQTTAPTEEGVVEEEVIEESVEEAAPVPPPAPEGAIQEETLPPERGATKRTEARASIQPLGGGRLSGTADFEETDSGLHVVVNLSGGEPGEHGVHIHEIGDCSAPDGLSAGDHFNPGKTAHGGPDAAPHHAGDLGNITIGPDGSGKLELTTKGVTLRTRPIAIIRRSIVIHAGRDDLASQPSGDSGARIGCGVIK